MNRAIVQVKIIVDIHQQKMTGKTERKKRNNGQRIEREMRGLNELKLTNEENPQFDDCLCQIDIA